MVQSCRRALEWGAQPHTAPASRPLLGMKGRSPSSRCLSPEPGPQRWVRPASRESSPLPQVGWGLACHHQKRVCGNLGAPSQWLPEKGTASRNHQQVSLPDCHPLGSLLAPRLSFTDLGVGSPHESKMPPGRGLVNPRCGLGGRICLLLLSFQPV